MANQLFFKKLQMSSDVTDWYYVAVGRGGVSNRMMGGA